MANWSMTINDKTYHSATISVGLWSAVQQLMGDRAVTFDSLQPYVGPDQMAAWYAVLLADSSENKDVQTHLRAAYAMPLADMVGLVNVE